MLTLLKKIALITLPASMLISTGALMSLVLIDTSVAEIEAPIAASVPSGHNRLVPSMQGFMVNLATESTVAQPEKIFLTVPSNPIDAASQQLQQGEMMQQAGNLETALAHYAVALSLAQAAGQRSFEGVIWHRVAQTYAAAQDTAHAAQFYQVAIAIARDTENDYELSAALANVGVLSEQQGQPQAALAYYQAALPMVRSLGNQPVEQLVSTRMAHIQQQQRQLAVASQKAQLVSKPGADQPATKPATTKPATAKPALVTKPATTKPALANQSVAIVVIDKPVTDKPVTDKPVSDKLVMN